MIKNKRCFVGFDTSNYTTSIAVCDEDGVVVANLKRLLPVKEGERGLRQSDAIFSHTKNLPVLAEELSVVLRDYDPIAVGVSATPRKVDGSYMPCFLAGKSAAACFAAAKGISVCETAHQNGHIMAAIYSSRAEERLMNAERFIAFHVSGGTTEALLITPNSSKTDFSIELVGATKDINAGQAIDRIGVMMGISFPCGKELEALATAYQGKIEKKNICVNDGYCSLSGVENIAKKMYDNGAERECVAAFVFDFICRTLSKMAEQLIEKYGVMPVLFAGGVMSNKLMRKELSSRLEAYFAEPEFSADNAAGVALLTRLKYNEEGI